jgi:Solute carrier family 35
MYILISLLDVLPNFLVLLALQYTSLTSVTLLLGSLTVPSTMFFSSRRLLLSRYFTRKHYMGACICVVGGMLAVGLDSSVSGKSSTETLTMSSTATSTTNLHVADSTTDSFLFLNVGDLLMCTAALLYGLGDTVAEYFVKHLDRDEYLGMLGVFGMLQTIVLFPLLEHDALSNAWATIRMDGEQLHSILQSGAIENGPISNNSNETKWLMLATLLWFVACQYLYYVMEVHFLATSDATLLNLSMQAANLWAIFFSVVFTADPAQQLLRHVLPPALFYVALVLVLSGVVLYELDGTKITAQQEQQHSQDKLHMQHCIIAKYDDEDEEEEEESLSNHEEDDSSEIKAVLLATRRYSDYQSCRI